MFMDWILWFSRGIDILKYIEYLVSGKFFVKYYEIIFDVLIIFLIGFFVVGF